MSPGNWLVAEIFFTSVGIEELKEIHSINIFRLFQA